MLDDHIDGYFSNGIKINEGDVVVDVGANIGVLGVRLSKNSIKLKFIALNLFQIFFQSYKRTVN